MTGKQQRENWTRGPHIAIAEQCSC